MKTILLISMTLFSSLSFANRESGGRFGASAVYAAFNSYGTGIDAKALSRYKNLVKKAKVQGKVIEETCERRGREGEVLTCVQLNSPFESYAFIKKLAPAIVSDTKANQFERTSVYLGPDCHDLAAATEQDLKGY